MPAFIGLERTTIAAVAVFDITDPSKVRYVDTIVGNGDLKRDRSPEVLTAFKVGSRYFVAIAHKVSDTASLYEVTLDPAQGPNL
mgnify:CR=1 FL=1